MLVCTLLTFAMCADPNLSASVTIGDLAVPIVWTRRQTRSCMDLGGEGVGGPGDARMGFAFAPHAPIRVIDARIELTVYSWKGMTRTDASALRSQYRATLWHEIGHFRTALQSIATVDARDLQPQDAFNQIQADQEAYDDITEHGIRQHDAPSPLEGADTIIACS